MQIKEISVEEAYKLVKKGKAILLDVRTKEEYEKEHVEGALLIPLHELPYKLNKLNKDKIILLCFCRSGNRSKIACNILKKFGFKKLYNVKGGILEWKKAGFKIVSKK